MDAQECAHGLPTDTCPDCSLIEPLQASIAIVRERDALRVQRDALQTECAELRNQHSFFMSCLLTQFGGRFELRARSMVDAPTNGAVTTWDDKVSGSRYYELKCDGCGGSGFANYGNGDVRDCPDCSKSVKS